jgi:hypothetical protein
MRCQAEGGPAKVSGHPLSSFVSGTDSAFAVLAITVLPLVFKKLSQRDLKSCREFL